MPTIENCINYLSTNYFTDISFLSESFNGECKEMFFSAVDEDDQLKKVVFEVDGSKVIVSVQDPATKVYYILETFSLND